MNIFVLDRDPDKAAMAHCDKHVVKMVLETAQLLSTTQRLIVPEDKIVQSVYKVTHKNHPCAKWVRESSGNYEWTWNLFYALCKEYSFRYGRIHKCESLLGPLATTPVPEGKLTEFVQAMPEHCKRPDPVDGYRNYYLTEKTRMLSWKRRDPPDWAK